MPFFILGYIINIQKIDIHKIHPILIFIFAIIYYFITENLPRFDMMNYNCGPTYIVFFITAICGSVVLFWICSWLPQSNIIQIFSIGTLLLLTMHMPLDFFIRPVFHRLSITPTESLIVKHLMPWLELIIVFILTYYPISWLNNHYPILLGKTSRKDINKSKTLSI